MRQHKKNQTTLLFVEAKRLIVSATVWLFISEQKGLFYHIGNVEEEEGIGYYITQKKLPAVE